MDALTHIIDTLNIWQPCGLICGSAYIKYHTMATQTHTASANRILCRYPGFHGTTGFWWCICRILGGAFWSALKCSHWRTIEGLQLVMHNVVSHYQTCWYMSCGRSMLKRVRNVTGMVSWWRLVACFSCFTLYDVYMCLHFASKRDILYPTVIFLQSFVELNSFQIHRVPFKYQTRSDKTSYRKIS